MRHAVLAVAATTALLIGLLAFAGFAQADDTAWKAAHDTDYGGYSGYFADPDGHPWEVVVAPGIELGADRRVHLAE